MTDASASANVLIQLEHSLASGNLPSKAQHAGKRFLDRLKSPVRTVISGLSGSGKSQLLNLLVGQCIVPGYTALPPLSLSWAQHPQTVVTLHDGTVESRDAVDLHGLTSARVKFVEARAALPILKRISLLEVTADQPMDNHSHAIDWATGRADIVLWCSQEFGPQERDIWSNVPDGLKDHSFLVLTKADAMSPADLQARISALQDVVAEEFHSLIPVATLQAIAAQASDTIDKPALNASGGAALIAAILRLVDLGRQADIDGVLLFLNRYGAISAVTARPAPVGIPDVAAVAIDVDPASNIEQSRQNQPDENPAELPAELPAALLGTALEFLRDCAAELTDIQRGCGAEDPLTILEHCAEAADQLVQIFMQDEGVATGPTEFHADLMEAADMMLLMQLEEGESAAADAVTLLLQLRRDIEMKMAA